MITQYKNIEIIRLADHALTANRIKNTTLDQLVRTLDLVKFDSTFLQQLNSRIEFHVYAGDTWITGNHTVQTLPQVPTYTDDQNQPISFANEPIAIDIYKQFSDLKIDAGNYRFILNFFRNWIGSYEQQYIVIDEISPDRTEIKLRAIDPENQDFLQQIALYANSINQTNTNVTGNSYNTIYKSFLLNFGRNQTVHYINSVVVGQYLYVKLQDPLPDNIEPEFKCWVVEERKMPYTDKVSISVLEAIKQFNQLSEPNWDAQGDYALSTNTGIQTWTNLLGSTVSTSQQIVDSYFSGSLSGIKLNIDYTDFNNFIFYSSAQERCLNFKYKLELLDYYNSQSVTISQISGSVATANSQEFETKRTNLISGFDEFERFLYYESSSVLYSNEYPHENPIVSDVTGSYITPVPKTNSTRPYELISVKSTEFNTWFNSMLTSAQKYDSKNINSLSNTIPAHVVINQDNIEFSTFVNMLGHHYDIIYTYANHMQKIHSREENPKLGIPNELLYDVAKQFGWNLIDGNDNLNLWDYVLGTDEAGTPLTGSNSVVGDSLPARDRTYAVWRRIVNNLPGLLKSKGTRRSIQALLSCYGIPQSLITIKEYGGPRTSRVPIYEKYNFNYSLDLINNTAGTVTINYDQPINSIELGFRTQNIEDNPNIPNTMNLFSVDGIDVVLDFTSGNKGTVQINGTASADIELYDGDWLNSLVKTNGSMLELVVAKERLGKIVAAVSASHTASFNSTGTITLGGTSGGSRLSGQLRELRLWTGSLNTEPFYNHTKAFGAYDANVDTYDELVFRLPLNKKIDHAATSSLTGAEPNPSDISASFASWTNDIPYDTFNDTYYYDGVSIGSATYDDNKVRIEQNELIGTLDLKTRAEQSQFDKAPLDSNRLGVYFSPQTMIDEDIIAHLGFTELDSYIGDPGETEKYSYPRLIQFAAEYWKKYENANDFNAYIKIFTLYDLSFFRQVSQLIPARVDKLTGILVQPNLLERSKDTILPQISKFNETYEALIDLDVDSYNITGSYTDLLGVIDDVINNPIADFYDTNGTFNVLSDNAIYDGFIYCYDQLFMSGSTLTTGSSAYWLCDVLLPTILSSTTSEFTTDSNGNPSDINDYIPTGLDNLFYNGSQMSSPGFNVASNDTIDGGPVVEINDANPNQIITQNNNNTNGNFQVN